MDTNNNKRTSAVPGGGDDDVVEARYSYYRAEAFMRTINPLAFIGCVIGMVIVGAMEVGALPHCKPFYSVRQLLYNEYISRGPFLVHDTFPTYSLAFVSILPLVLCYWPLCYWLKYKAAPKTSSRPTTEKAAPTAAGSSLVVDRAGVGAREEEEDLAGKNYSNVESQITLNSDLVAINIPSNATGNRRRLRFTPKQFAIATALLWTLVQLESIVLTLIVTDGSKFYAGNYRPDFLGRLQHEGYLPEAPRNELFSADATTISPAMKAFQDAATNLFPYLCPATDLSPLPPGYVANDTLVHALQHNPLLKDGRMSFPSGHSSISFGSMVPMCFFLAIEVFEPIKYRCVFRLIASCIPIILAFTIAISRTRDQRHHFSDILAGSVIGATCAFVAVSLNFAAITYGTSRSGLVARQPLIAHHLVSDTVLSEIAGRGCVGDVSANNGEGAPLYVTPTLDEEPPMTLFRKAYLRVYPSTA